MMERSQYGSLPTLPADVNALTHQLESMYRAVKAASGDRREPDPEPSTVGMVIRGK